MLPKEIVALTQQTLLSLTGRRGLDALSGDYISFVVNKIAVSQYPVAYTLGIRVKSSQTDTYM